MGLVVTILLCLTMSWYRVHVRIDDLLFTFSSLFALYNTTDGRPRDTTPRTSCDLSISWPVGPVHLSGQDACTILTLSCAWPSPLWAYNTSRLFSTFLFSYSCSFFAFSLLFYSILFYSIPFHFISVWHDPRLLLVLFFSMRFDTIL